MIIEDGLFYYPWETLAENNCNSYIIGKDAAVLVDVGHLKYLATLLTSMEKDGFAPQNLNLIITTHCHPDHFEALSQFVGSNVLTAIHREEYQYLKDRGEILYQMMGTSSPQVNADFFLTEGTLTLGKIDLQIYHTPGHSPGSICLYWPEKKTLISGDVVFSGGVGRTDLPGGDADQLKHSIQRLAELDVEIFLPGHGEILVGRKKVTKNFDFIREHYFPFL